jgi:Cu(I)-responsive transcriptional regulator
MSTDMSDLVLTIGEVAHHSGVPAKTIRYYEQIALIPAAERALNGYRLYSDRAVQILRFVKRARDLGFDIKAVAALLDLWQDQERSSAEVKRLAEQHLNRLERKIAELEGLKATLLHLVHECRGDDRPDCPILEDLAVGPRR